VFKGDDQVGRVEKYRHGKAPEVKKPVAMTDITSSLPPPRKPAHFLVVLMNRLALENWLDN
jgi:hypothetical protein